MGADPPNRTDFIPTENLNGGEYKLGYERRGGCFVTTKTALFFVFMSISSIVIAVVLVYFFKPNPSQNQVSIVRLNYFSETKLLCIHYTYYRKT